MYAVHDTALCIAVAMSQEDSIEELLNQMDIEVQGHGPTLSAGSPPVHSHNNSNSKAANSNSKAANSNSKVANNNSKAANSNSKVANSNNNMAHSNSNTANSNSNAANSDSNTANNNSKAANSNSNAANTCTNIEPLLLLLQAGAEAGAGAGAEAGVVDHGQTCTRTGRAEMHKFTINC